MRSVLIGAAALALAALTGAADAAQYNFSYGITTGTPTPTIYAAGIITTGTQTCGPGCFYVTDVTGTNRGAAITGYDSFADSDQQFYPTAASHVSGSGLTYQVGSTSYNIYATGGGYNEFHFVTDTGNQIGSSAYASFFTVTPVAAAVPEPATWAMLVGGMGLAGAALRRRRPVLVA